MNVATRGLKLNHDNKQLIWSKCPLFLQQQPNEKWDKSRNEMQLVYSNPKIESEMNIAVVHSSQRQFEKKLYSASSLRFHHVHGG